MALNWELYKKGESDLIQRALRKKDEVSLYYISDEEIDRELIDAANEALDYPDIWEDGEAMAYYCICEYQDLEAAEEWLKLFREYQEDAASA